MKSQQHRVQDEHGGDVQARAATPVIDVMACAIPGVLGSLFWSVGLFYTITGGGLDENSGDPTDLSVAGIMAGIIGALVAVILVVSAIGHRRRLRAWMWALLSIGLSPVVAWLIWSVF